MARRKNQPEIVRAKCSIAERLRQIRIELFGERGGSEMARRLEVPIRTWYNYESGVTVPAEVLLRFMEMTSVEPLWLLHGRGPKYRTAPRGGVPTDTEQSVQSLLRSALQQLERERRSIARPPVASFYSDTAAEIDPGEAAGGAATAAGPGFEAQRGWQLAETEGRCLRVVGDAMTPILSEGAWVAYSAEEESLDELEGALIVAWVDGEPLVRWFRRSGSYGLLRAENPEHGPSIHLIDLTQGRGTHRLRRVLWISTPH